MNNSNNVSYSNNDNNFGLSKLFNNNNFGLSKLFNNNSNNEITYNNLTNETNLPLYILKKLKLTKDYHIKILNSKKKYNNKTILNYKSIQIKIKKRYNEITHLLSKINKQNNIVKLKEFVDKLIEVFIKSSNVETERKKKQLYIDKLKKLLEKYYSEQNNEYSKIYKLLMVLKNLIKDFEKIEKEVSKNMKYDIDPDILKIYSTLFWRQRRLYDYDYPFNVYKNSSFPIYIPQNILNFISITNNLVIEQLIKNNVISKTNLTRLPYLLKLDINNPKTSLYIYFGLNKLSKYNFFQRYNIFYYILLYLIPIVNDFKITDYLKYDNYLLKISSILIENLDKKTIINLKNKKLIGEGLYGKVYENSNGIYKVEKLRYRGIVVKDKYTPAYSVYNYVPSTILLSYIIQNYLFSLNNNYVPKINDIYFYTINEERIVYTLMHSAFNKKINSIENNYELLTFIKDRYNKKNFVKDFFKILIKICDILIYYQDICSFVHYDFHLKNILLDYEYNEDDILIKYNIKLIDFANSSIVLKINNNAYLLKYINIDSRKNPYYYIPYNSHSWYIIDMFMFINRLVIRYKDYREFIEPIRNIIIDIFNFNINCREIADEEIINLQKKNKYKSINIEKLSILLINNIELRTKIYGENTDYTLLNLKKKL